METQLWAQIERIVRGGEREDIRLFVALTRDEMAGRFSTAEELQKGYQKLAVHLHRLRARDDFWRWVDQQFPLGEISELVVTPGLEEAIVNDLSRLNLRRPVMNSLRDIPNRLLAGGWAFSLVWFSLALVCGDFDPLPIFGHLELSDHGLELLPYLLTLAFWSVFCRALLGPFRLRWRRMVRGVSPLLSGAVTGGVLCGVSLIVYFLGRYSLLILELQEKLDTNLAITLVAFLRPGAFILEINESGGVALGALIAWFAFSVMSGFLRKRPWLLERPPATVDWFVSGVVALVLLLSLIHYLNLVHRTHQVSGVVMATQDSESEPEPNLDLLDRFVAKAGKIDPAKRNRLYFNQNPNGSTTGQSELYQLFLEVGKELWEKPNWWNAPEFRPLAEETSFRVTRFGYPASEVYGSDAIEAEIRLSFFEFSWAILFLLDRAQLTENEWSRLLPLTDQMVGRSPSPICDFPGFFRQTVNERSYPFLEGWFFDPSEVRDALEFQKVWETYQSHRALLDRKTFYSREEALQVEADLDRRARELFRIRLLEATEKRKEMLLWFLVRIKSRIAAGRPLPETLEEFHPPASSGPLDWFRYKLERREVILSLTRQDNFHDKTYRFELP